MKKLIPTFLVLFLSLGFTATTQAQVKYGIVAYQYFKNSEGKRIIYYYYKSSIYNSVEEAKASVDIWYKTGDKKDSEITYDVISQDVGADDKSKTYYSGTFTARVRNKEGVERTIEDVRYCYYRSIPDLEEAIVSTISVTDDIIEPVKFNISKCKP